jgi:hypothetical protein
MDCAEIKSDTLWIYSIKIFLLIKAMAMASKQNLAGTGQECIPQHSRGWILDPVFSEWEHLN